MSYEYTCNKCGKEVTDPELDSHLEGILGEYHGFSQSIKHAIKEMAKTQDLGVYYPADETTDIVQLCPKCDQEFIEKLKIKPEKI